MMDPLDFLSIWTKVGGREDVMYLPIQVISSDRIWILIYNNLDDSVDGSLFPGFFSPFLQ